MLPHCGQRRGLARHPLEVLDWIGDGKTIQDLAPTMRLIAATHGKRLRLAREVAAVETTA